MIISQMCLCELRWYILCWQWVVKETDEHCMKVGVYGGYFRFGCIHWLEWNINTHTHRERLISSKKADGEIYSTLSLYLFILFHSLKKYFSRVCHFSFCLPSHFCHNLPWLSSGTANPLWIWIGWKNGGGFSLWIDTAEQLFMTFFCA